MILLYTNTLIMIFWTKNRRWRKLHDIKIFYVKKNKNYRTGYVHGLLLVLHDGLRDEDSQRRRSSSYCAVHVGLYGPINNLTIWERGEERGGGGGGGGQGGYEINWRKTLNLRKLKKGEEVLIMEGKDTQTGREIHRQMGNHRDTYRHITQDAFNSIDHLGGSVQARVRGVLVVAQVARTVRSTLLVVVRIIAEVLLWLRL